MNYRGFEIKVVVGIDRKWKWSVQLPVGRREGEARLRNEAVAAARTAIDRAVGPRKV
jgi:hypothetical protein